jgi:hypothetical protein
VVEKRQENDSAPGLLQPQVALIQRLPAEYRNPSRFRLLFALHLIEKSEDIGRFGW